MGGAICPDILDVNDGSYTVLGSDPSGGAICGPAQMLRMTGDAIRFRSLMGGAICPDHPSS